MNAELERLHTYVIRLRCGDPPKGTRAEALSYLARQIQKLAARSVEAGGTEGGWDDAADVLAGGDQILGLRAEMDEIARPDAPYPLGPLTEDPFGMDPPRLYNGRRTT